jgi:trigger factor
VKVTREKIEDSQVFLTVEMEPDETEKSLEKSYRSLVKKANIPGFRKGKAPRDILERFVGKEKLIEEALNNSLPQAYEEALKEQDIEPIAHPRIEVTQTDPVVFKAVVPLRPVVELDDYHDIQVTPEPVEVTEDDVKTAMEQLRHQQATWEPVERVAEFNDLVVLNVVSELEGKPFINQKGAQYQVLRDLSLPMPGFAEQLLGMGKDEEKEFKLQFPSDYPRSELVGKEPSFKVTVVEIKEEKLPDLNDEFAKQIGADFKTMDLLRDKLATNLRIRAEEKSKSDYEERVVEAVIALAQVKFPPVLVDREISWLVRQQLQGGKNLEEYLSNINKTEEELKEELRPIATKRVTRYLILGKIAEEEKIEVSDSEVNADIENMLNNTTENKDELQKFLETQQSRDSVKQMLITRKTMQGLVKIAQDKNSDDGRKKKK